MAIGTSSAESASTPRSRRAILAAAGGGLAALAAGALAGAGPALATTGDTVHVGDQLSATTTTAITNTTTGNDVFDAISTSGTALSGLSASGDGVDGASSSGFGISGFSSSNVGVVGFSSFDVGVRGVTRGSSTGAYGYSGPNTLPAAAAKTGVFGIGDADATAKGVYGKSPAGQGVRGEATTTGVGVYATAPTTGVALQAAGKVKFSRSGKVTMAAGTSTKTISLAGVTTGSLIFAVLASNRSGRYVRAVVPGSGSFTIYLNATVLSSTFVIWFVLN